jgi:hypothetical protein
MRHFWYGALTALIVISGCKSNDKSPGSTPAPSASAPAKTGPLAVKWVGKRFSIEGEKARGNFVVPSAPDGSTGLLVRSYLYDFPPGTKATFGGKTETVETGKPLVQSAEFIDKIAKLTLDDVQRKRVELELPLTISYPGRGELKLKSPGLRIAHAIAHDLTRAEKEPTLYAGEKADAAGPLDTVAIIRVRSRSRRMRILGNGKTVADIDWVAIERTHGEPRDLECPRPGAKPRVIKLTDLEIAIFDRRLGKPVESKVFPGKAQCNPPAKGAKAPKTQREEIDSWLYSKLGIPEPPPSAVKPPSDLEPEMGEGKLPLRPASPLRHPSARPAAPPPAPPTDDE